MLEPNKDLEEIFEKAVQVASVNSHEYVTLEHFLYSMLNNEAFAKLPKGTVETLLKPENKSTLTKILTYHVVAGNLDAAAVVKAINDGKGKVTLKAVSGGTLTASLKNGKVILTDEKGGTATVTATDLKAGNGIVHVIDAVVLPK
jgi:uncharacterized surface protein with fasciclin (FAS1) repeats